MPRYPLVVAGGQRFYPMRYNDLPAGEANAPVTQLVPFHDSLDDALTAVRAHVESLLAPLRQQFSGSSADPNASYRDLLANPTVFFRGQDSQRFSIVPTRFRLAGVSDLKGEVTRRVQWERERAAAIQEYYRQRGIATLDDLQARAVARHFGAPSALVDFTFDPDVAGAFAQPPFSDREQRDGAPLGVLYAIDMGQLQQMFGLLAWGIGPDGSRDIHLVNTKSIWGVEFLRWDEQSGDIAPKTLGIPVPDALRLSGGRLRTCIVPGVSRIEAQRGLFLELSLPDETDMMTQLRFWTILDFMARKWCFRRSSEPYVVRDEGAGVRDLFHEHDPGLERVAAGAGK